MQLSSSGLVLLKQCEGLRTRVYLDIAGIPTIGYGHRLLAGESFPDGITEDRAAQLLLNDIHFAETCIQRLVTVPLTQGQYDALVDFVFNLGDHRLAESTLLRELNAGHYDSAGDQLLRWDHSGLREIPALKSRRASEFALWHAAPSISACAA
jgi:lysozyme